MALKEDDNVPARTDTNRLKTTIKMRVLTSPVHKGFPLFLAKCFASENTLMGRMGAVRTPSV